MLSHTSWPWGWARRWSRSRGRSCTSTEPATPHQCWSIHGHCFSRDYYWNPGTSGWRPDLHALRAARDRLIIGIGDTSAGLFCDRTSRALGAELGIEPTLFPGGHTGFVEDPAAFAARLRGVVG